KLLNVKSNLFFKNEVRTLSFSGTKLRDVVDRKEMLRSLPTLDDGSAGEKAMDVDLLIHKKADIFPDENTPNRLFNGVPFKNLPIMNIRVSPNNTIVNMTDYKGEVKLIRSCGVEESVRERHQNSSCTCQRVRTRKNGTVEQPPNGRFGNRFNHRQHTSFMEPTQATETKEIIRQTPHNF
ncbi:28S ribosomal protein S11, mitochondrial, partial [Asbolus verrucosus]